MNRVNRAASDLLTEAEVHPKASCGIAALYTVLFWIVVFVSVAAACRHLVAG